MFALHCYHRLPSVPSADDIVEKTSLRCLQLRLSACLKNLRLFEKSMHLHDHHPPSLILHSYLSDGHVNEATEKL